MNRPAGNVKRPRMARADRERQMVEVAEEVFAERGYQSASMDEIADRVGVSKPMLYAYFGSKNGLMLACIRRARAELREVTTAAVAAGGTPYDLMRRGLVAHFRFVDAHKRAWAILRTEAALGGAAAAEVEEFRNQQAQLIAESVAGFAPDVDPMFVDAYAQMLVGATERLSLWRERHPQITPEAAAELVLAVLGGDASALLGPVDGPAARPVDTRITRS